MNMNDSNSFHLLIALKLRASGYIHLLLILGKESFEIINNEMSIILNEIIK
jgi:hypothetical protein